MQNSRTAFINGHVITMDDNHTEAQAFIIEDKMFTVVGSNSEIREESGSDTKFVDLNGKTVTPGLIDAHTHLEMLAYALELSVDCRSPKVSSIEQMIGLLRERAQSVEPGQWVLGQGNHFQDTMLRDRRYPDRYDLDKASSHHPILYRPSTHLTVFNSAAIRLLSITSDTPDAPGGSIERDSAGELTGRVFEMYEAVGGPEASLEQMKSGIRGVIDRYLKVGVTAVGDIPLLPGGLPAVRELAEDNDLDLRVVLYPEYPSVIPYEAAAASNFFEELSSIRPEKLTAGGVKMFLDGGLTARAAALYDPYPDSSDEFGLLGYEESELRNLVADFASTGRQVLVHAIGDRALDVAIRAVSAAPIHNDEAPHRIEHAGNLFMTEDRINELAKARFLPVPQPSFVFTTADGYEEILGDRRNWKLFPIRSLLESGVRLPGNTDAVGLRLDQHSPFLAMSAAVNRKSMRGNIISPDQSISVSDMFWMYTRNSARAIGKEKIIGSIEVGKCADFVLFTDDPRDSAAEAIADIAVDETWVGGEQVYKRP